MFSESLVRVTIACGIWRRFKTLNGLLKNVDNTSKTYFLTVTVSSFFTLFFAVSNVPLARAIVGFVYLMFVPGNVLVRMLGIRDLDVLKSTFFSVGLSNAFIILFGLLINFLYPVAGVNNPFSSTILLVSIIIAVEIMAVLKVTLIKDKSLTRTVIPIKASKSYIVTILMSVTLPVLSVVGAFFVNIYDNNIVLMLMIAFVPIVFVVVCLQPRLIGNGLYVFALFMIALALLFHSSLITSYIYGGDVHMEYHLFEITQVNSRWFPTVNSTDLGYNWLNAMLSITILPTSYSNILGIDGTWVFKVIVPTIFSFVAIGLYLMYKREFGSKVALLSVFFFMSNSVFFTDDIIGNLRQMMAELFYVSILLVLLDKQLENRNQTILSIVFGTALVFSHYATSYLFLFMIIGMWLYGTLLKKSECKIKPSVIVSFSVIMFSWYIYISNSGPFRGLLETYNWVTGSFMNQFLVAGSRGETVMAGLGVAGLSTFWHLLGRSLFYLTEFLIIVGFIFLILKRKNSMVSNRYFSLIFLNMVVLAACLIVPSFANTLNMTRFYHLILFFLAPLFVIGGLEISQLIRRKVRIEIGTALILCILIPFFLFQTGFVYQVAGDVNYSVPLNKDNMGLIPYVSQSVVSLYDVAGAKWVLKNVNYANTSVGSDLVSSRALNSYGMIYSNTIDKFSNTTIVKLGEIIFLGWINSVKGTIADAYGGEYNTTAAMNILYPQNIVYSSGGCIIYKNPG